MLSKGIIHLGRGELVVPTAQEVYVAALKMKTVRACYATLQSGRESWATGGPVPAELVFQEVH